MGTTVMASIVVLGVIGVVAIARLVRGTAQRRRQEAETLEALERQHVLTQRTIDLRDHLPPEPRRTLPRLGLEPSKRRDAAGSEATAQEPVDH